MDSACMGVMGAAVHRLVWLFLLMGAWILGYGVYSVFFDSTPPWDEYQESLEDLAYGDR